MNIPDVFCVSVPWTFAQRFATSPQFESSLDKKHHPPFYGLPHFSGKMAHKIQTMMAQTIGPISKEISS